MHRRATDIHPKVAAAGIVSVIASVVVAVLATQDVIVDQAAVVSIITMVLTVFTGYMKSA